MPDNDDQLIKCPSCGHENTTYVHKCIICDFPLARYINQPQTRQMSQSAANFDETVAQTNKKLGPLPDSDMLIDKRKKTPTPTAPKLLKCPSCGEKSRFGSVMCHNCGERLNTLAHLEHSIVPFEETQEVDSAPLNEHSGETQSVADNLARIRNNPTETPAIFVADPLNESSIPIPSGCVKFTSWMMLQLDIIGYDTPIVIRPIEDKPLLIGRRHESLPVQPHIDLTPYLSERHGISRRHALLRLRGTRLELQDLKSTNGTSINGVRFAPKESHQLRHKDIVHIGQVQIQVQFIKQVRSASIGHTEELGKD